MTIGNINNGELGSSCRSKINSTIDKINILGEYDASSTYSLNNIISYNGILYKSLQNSNTGNTPDTSTSFWAIFPTDIYLEKTTFTNQEGIIYKDTDRWIYDFGYGDNGTVTPNGENIFIGKDTGNLNLGATATSSSESSYNVGLGYNSVSALTTGAGNLAVGPFTLYNCTTGNNNISIGSSNLVNTVDGDSNVALGLGSLYFNTGSNNIAIGEGAAAGKTANDNVIAIGHESARFKNGGGLLQNVQSSIYVGADILGEDNDNNSIVIGNSGISEGANKTVLGNSSTTDTHIFGNINIDAGKEYQINGNEIFAKDTVLVSSASDLPTPSGGFIDLQANTKYVFYEPNPGDTSPHIITIADSLRFPDSGSCELFTNSSGNVFINYTGVGAALTSNTTFGGIAVVRNCTISAPSGSIFDMKGLEPSLPSTPSRLFIFETGFIDFVEVGTIKDIVFSINTGGFAVGDGGTDAGLILDSVKECAVDNVRFNDWANASDTTFIRVQGDIGAMRIGNCIFEPEGSNETLFDISPTLTSNSEILLIGNQNLDSGPDFKVRNTGSITSIADATTTGSITSVTNNSGVAVFNDTGHGLVNFQTVVHSGFSESTYNGTFYVTNATANTYEVESKVGGTNLAYVSGDTGSWSAGSITISTPTTTGLSGGTEVNIFNTINYDGGGYVYNIVSNTSFDISRTYSSAETPSLAEWNSGSLLPTDERINSNSNVRIENTLPLAAITAQNTSMDATVINTINVFEDLDLTVGATGQARALDGINRFSLTDNTNGEVRYDGTVIFTGVLVATIAFQAVSTTPNYVFRVLKNGSIDVGTIRSEVAASSTQVGTVSVEVPIKAVATDTFKIQVANTSSTVNLQIRGITLLIK